MKEPIFFVSEPKFRIRDELDGKNIFWSGLFCFVFEPFFVFRSEMSRKRDCWTFGVNWRSPFFVLLELKYVEQVHLSGLSLDLMRCLRFSQRTTFPWAKFTLGAWESPDFFPRRVDYTIAIIFSYDFNVTAYKGSARVPALVGTNNTWYVLIFSPPPHFTVSVLRH